MADSPSDAQAEVGLQTLNIINGSFFCGVAVAARAIREVLNVYIINVEGLSGKSARLRITVGIIRPARARAKAAKPGAKPGLLAGASRRGSAPFKLAIIRLERSRPPGSGNSRTFTLSTFGSIRPVLAFSRFVHWCRSGARAQLR